jgi:hypothetical protein
MCTLLLKETIVCYTTNDSPVYCIMLDATKAFDRVDYCKLFRELLKRNLPVVFSRLLLLTHFTYVTNHACPMERRRLQDVYGFKWRQWTWYCSSRACCMVAPLKSNK